MDEHTTTPAERAKGHDRHGQHQAHTREAQTPRAEKKRERKRAMATGAALGAVTAGPIGAPIGAAAGAVVDALKRDPDAPVAHTHPLDAPCYDGCPAWKSARHE